MATTRRAASSNEGNEETMSDNPIIAGVEDIAGKASQAIQNGLQKLDPEIVQIGQAALSSIAMAAAPVRRALRSQPALAGTGLFSIAVGGVLLGLAITRDNRGGATTRKKAD